MNYKSGTAVLYDHQHLCNEAVSVLLCFRNSRAFISLTVPLISYCVFFQGPPGPSGLQGVVGAPGPAVSITVLWRSSFQMHPLWKIITHGLIKGQNSLDWNIKFSTIISLGGGNIHCTGHPVLFFLTINDFAEFENRDRFFLSVYLFILPQTSVNWSNSL